MSASPEGTHLEPPPPLEKVVEEMRAYAHQCRLDATDGRARSTNCYAIEMWANAIEEARAPRHFTKEELSALEYYESRHGDYEEAEKHKAVVRAMLDSSKGGET